MDIRTIVADVEQWTTTEVHELKAWLDAHVLHRAASAEPVVAEPVVAAPAAEPEAPAVAEVPPAEPAAV